MSEHIKRLIDERGEDAIEEIQLRQIQDLAMDFEKKRAALHREIENLFPLLGVKDAMVTDLSMPVEFPKTGNLPNKYLWQIAIDRLRVERDALAADLERHKRWLHEVNVEWHSKLSAADADVAALTAERDALRSEALKWDAAATECCEKAHIAERDSLRAERNEDKS